jgi:2',3'-cyclic-nucleotide 2'-phosphodiesterase (5'-nucleotidase family)
MVHGTNIVNLFSGIPMIEAMNDIGFAATVLGNHEFNYGQQVLKALESDGKLPISRLQRGLRRFRRAIRRELIHH